MQWWRRSSTRTCGSTAASEARPGRVRSSVISLRVGGELEKELFEVEALSRHLVDGGACAGGCEANRLGRGLERHDDVAGDRLCPDALRRQCGAQRLGVRGADADRWSAAPREL